MKRFLIVVMGFSLAGCATLTEDAMDPVALSFSDGSAGDCRLSNKRGVWQADIPSVVSVRKSDDDLKYECNTKDGREAFGSLESKMGAKIVASAVFIDFGITDAITDKHRDYADSFVIPVPPREDASQDVATPGSSEKRIATSERNSVYSQLEDLNSLKERGIITEEEFDVEKKRLLAGE